jgi:hypothetical protein
MSNAANSSGATPPPRGESQQRPKVIVIESFAFSAAEQRAISTALTAGRQSRATDSGAARVERRDMPAK